MVRTQIYLTEKEKDALTSMSKILRKKQSILIREAVDEYIQKHDMKHRVEMIERVAGLWKNRTDIQDIKDLRKEWDRNFS